ncbi:hypothetical protein FB45DRAFT_1062998 [Roridomyces roridus]|uniref:Uncharacterized protein n=1 Tax=Roridomyces roridus TaxID=1738132 RepID=A0AAD7BFW4_9AGAR|nr:hypothetical protein FB45DRAFT_1062998 [Roridomyces roridus]
MASENHTREAPQGTLRRSGPHGRTKEDYKLVSWHQRQCKPRPLPDPTMSMRPRYTLLPSNDDETDGIRPPPSPSHPRDDEEENLTRAPPVVYPPDPRFIREPPPTWQRVALILTIIASMALAVYLQNGWTGALIFD